MLQWRTTKSLPLLKKCKITVAAAPSVFVELNCCAIDCITKIDRKFQNFDYSSTDEEGCSSSVDPQFK